MAAYLVVDPDWQDTDLETRATFGRATQPVINHYGGRFLTPPGTLTSEPLEGDWTPKILTIVEILGAASARRMWASPEFRAAVAIRQGTEAIFKIVLVDVDPAQQADGRTKESRSCRFSGLASPPKWLR